MATLYVASTETFVGKSATCVGLLDQARRDGFYGGLYEAGQCLGSAHWRMPCSTKMRCSFASILG